METLSSLLWNPLLALVYIEIGIVFLIMTRFAAIRGVIANIRAVWANRTSGPDEGRHVAHHHAFLAALSASVGVGNLAGVGTAIHLGGPGALFWMWVSAILGMSFRMSSTYFSVKLARRGDKPELFATPMLYLASLLKSPWTGMAAVLASLLMVKGMVTANLIQANSVAHAISGEIGMNNIMTAALLSGLVATVIIGGFRSILRVGVMAAPWMILGYLCAGWFILLSDPKALFDALGDVFTYAFQPFSIAGGVVGYTILEAMQFGVSRGIFSHGSGIGMAPFWQAANKDDPARGAFMAAAVPLVDTLIICSTTALVILTADHWLDKTGAFLTVSSFEHFLGANGRLFVTACLVVFAFTTIINWAHFSERCFEYLGGRDVQKFRWFFASLTFIGPFLPLAPLWSLGDVLIGTMILVNLLPLTFMVVRHADVMRHDLLDRFKDENISER